MNPKRVERLWRQEGLKVPSLGVVDDPQHALSGRGGPRPCRRSDSVVGEYVTEITAPRVESFFHWEHRYCRVEMCSAKSRSGVDCAV